MKRFYLLVLLMLVAGGLALLGLAIAEHKGYVLFAYQGFRYESSLWVFLALMVAILLVVYLVRQVLRLVFVSGEWVNPWSRRHRSRRVKLATEQGFVDLVEGRWEHALRHLRRAGDHSPLPLMYYLGAARAAHQLEKYSESEALLEKAVQRQPQAELAVALTDAEFQIERGETQAALETLQVMHERYPDNQQVLFKLQEIYVERKEWSALLGLLPKLRKDKVLTDAQLEVIEAQAWSGRLADAGHTDEQSADSANSTLTNAWQQLSANQRQEPQLLAVYADQLRALGNDDGAEELLRSALQRKYDSRLVRLYGLLRSSNPARQLQAAEGWLKGHSDDAGLLLTLGRLCLHNKLWGKARDYLESSMRLQRHPETCAELARLLAQLGEVERSNQLFQEGLGLLDQRLIGLPRAASLSR
ncbi:heme biosynthesis HemY N-terminal domain-containing protein [Pseudomonas marincola]|uniref:heme biosynthesis HemY N-terminal domain-containing protein n=1 Tax=Pseudomonas marincola TaxID=437900 RepID=UPI0008E129F0|nr:heme biosynthesis HemY N-terminal domain-containing protein [Pseudomonas marincola]SFT70883.1 HemY protein [Pseudomonas marincola]